MEPFLERFRGSFTQGTQGAALMKLFFHMLTVYPTVYPLVICPRILENRHF